MPHDLPERAAFIHGQNLDKVMLYDATFSKEALALRGQCKHFLVKTGEERLCYPPSVHLGSH